MEMIQILIAGFSAAGGGAIIAGFVLRKLDRMEKARINESIVTLRGLQAIGHLAEATAVAQKRGHTNGETETALKYYAKARDEINDYLMQSAAENAHGRA